MLALAALEDVDLDERFKADDTVEILSVQFVGYGDNTHVCECESGIIYNYSFLYINMKACPNGNPDFYDMFDSIVGNHTPETRRRLYYGVCIPLRLSIFFLMMAFHRNKVLLTIVAILALIELFRKGSRWNEPSRQWWSVRFQTVMAASIFIAASGALFGKIDSVWLPRLWLLSIFGGVAQNMWTPIC